MEHRFCLLCEKNIKGRADKKFCDDACRNQYNNQLSAQKNILLTQINNILKRNRKILEDLVGNEDLITVSLNVLRSKFFDFTYHTHVYQTQKEKKYIFCYEFGYLLIENEKVLIVKKKS